MYYITPQLEARICTNTHKTMYERHKKRTRRIRHKLFARVGKIGILGFPCRIFQTLDKHKYVLDYRWNGIFLCNFFMRHFDL